MIVKKGRQYGSRAAGLTHENQGSRPHAATYVLYDPKVVADTPCNVSQLSLRFLRSGKLAPLKDESSCLNTTSIYYPLEVAYGPCES